jgi:rod shape determining protein RodA
MIFNNFFSKSTHSILNLDKPLVMALVILSGLGLIVLYSAGGEDLDLISRQLLRIAMGFSLLLLFAQVQIQKITPWVPYIYLAGIVLLVAVYFVGEVSNGSRRWLDLGVFRFQPSEMMKLAVPMMVSKYLADQPLPPSFGRIIGALIIVLVPMLLVAEEPDLGTALLITSSGMFVLWLAGTSWTIILSFIGLGGASLPFVWLLLQEYQRERIRTFFDPERNPLGAGYHIIQSKIAIGSGGLHGKGWLNGTQSHLEFLPERSTDFIFAVYSEEFGLIGALILLSIYIFILSRGTFIVAQAQGNFARLFAGSLVLSFFIYIFVNIGMVTGVLPVVGVPLPFISYGGTSLVTLMAGFGLLMAVHTQRRVW